MWLKKNKLSPSLIDPTIHWVCDEMQDTNTLSIIRNVHTYKCAWKAIHNKILRSHIVIIFCIVFRYPDFSCTSQFSGLIWVTLKNDPGKLALGVLFFCCMWCGGGQHAIIWLEDSLHFPRRYSWHHENKPTNPDSIALSGMKQRACVPTNVRNLCSLLCFTSPYLKNMRCIISAACNGKPFLPHNLHVLVRWFWWCLSWATILYACTTFIASYHAACCSAKLTQNKNIVAFLPHFLKYLFLANVTCMCVLFHSRNNSLIHSTLVRITRRKKDKIWPTMTKIIYNAFIRYGYCSHVPNTQYTIFIKSTVHVPIRFTFFLTLFSSLSTHHFPLFPSLLTQLLLLLYARQKVCISTTLSSSPSAVSSIGTFPQVLY